MFGIGAAFASLPFFASLAALQPPWPPAIGFVSSALVLLGALLVWEFTRSSKVKRRRRYILVATVISVAGLIVYLFIYSLFVENLPGTSERVIRGYDCTDSARVVYESACPHLPSEALLDAGGDPLLLWTRSSVTTVRLGLTAAWLLFTAGLTMAVGAVVAGRKFNK